MALLNNSKILTFYQYFNIFIFAVSYRFMLKFFSFKTALSLITKSRKKNETALDTKSYKSMHKRIRRLTNFFRSDNCLLNALIFFKLNFHHDAKMDLIIGVRKDSKENFFSHAWVEVDNQPINEDKDLSKYKIIFKKQS